MGSASRISLVLGLLGVLVVTADAWGGPQDERECEERRASLYEDLVERRNDGPEARRVLMDRLQVLKNQYGETAPICLGRLQEHTAFLYVMDERYAEMEAWIARYLEGAGSHTSVRSKIMLHNHRGYALRQLGRSLEGAQATFRAASFADQAEAVHGAVQGAVRRGPERDRGQPRDRPGGRPREWGEGRAGACTAPWTTPWAASPSHGAQ